MNGGTIVDIKNCNKSNSMHLYGEITVDLNMMNLDLNADLYVDLHVDLYGDY